MDTLMTIGEFSNRCGLSARVLRNYADIGVLVPAAVDPESGYRYYEDVQLGQAEVVALLRRAGVAVADIGRFLGDPSAEELDGWERSLVAEVHNRRQALAEVRGRLNLNSGQMRGATVIEIQTVLDRVELEEVFNLIGGQLAKPIRAGDDHRVGDLETHFPADQGSEPPWV